MRNSRMFFPLVIALLIAFSLTWAAEKQRPTKTFMRQKLAYSQGILEGLTLEKYDLVITNATLLRNMNLTNIFTKSVDPYYAKSLTNFQTRVDVVIKGARQKLLEGTTQAYANMLESCVACHKECRLDQFGGKQSTSK